jgi:putative hydrolase of the HAD superfamily
MNPKITLLIDADDTLWENNKYFENVIDIVVDFLLEYSSVPEKEIRNCIWKNEKIIAKQFGYGSESFAKALMEVVKETLPNQKENIPKYLKQ